MKEKEKANVPKMILSSYSLKKQFQISEGDKLKETTSLSDFEKLKALSIQSISHLFGNRSYTQADLNIILDNFVSKEYSTASNLMKESNTIEEFWRKVEELFYHNWYSKDNRYHTFFCELFRSLTQPKEFNEHLEIFDKLNDFKIQHIVKSVELEKESEEYQKGFKKALQTAKDWEAKDIVFSTAGRNQLESISHKIKDFEETEIFEIKKKLKENIDEKDRERMGFQLSISGNKNMGLKRDIRRKEEKTTVINNNNNNNNTTTVRTECPYCHKKHLGVCTAVVLKSTITTPTKQYNNNNNRSYQQQQQRPPAFVLPTAYQHQQQPPQQQQQQRPPQQVNFVTNKRPAAGILKTNTIKKTKM
jgi:hypothetical protein